MIGGVLPKVGWYIDAWPDSRLAEVAPYRCRRVVSISETEIELDAGARIPIRSAWRRNLDGGGTSH